LFLDTIESDFENTLGDQDPMSLQLSSKSVYNDNTGDIEVEVKVEEGIEVGGEEEEKKGRDEGKEKITKGEMKGLGGEGGGEGERGEAESKIQDADEDNISEGEKEEKAKEKEKEKEREEKVGQDEMKKERESKKAKQLKVEKARAREEHGADIEVLLNQLLTLLPLNSFSLHLLLPLSVPLPPHFNIVHSSLNLQSRFALLVLNCSLTIDYLTINYLIVLFVDKFIFMFTSLLMILIFTHKSLQ
jgi:hypothetical protein